MTDGNYQRHFKVLGKLARLYDVAAASSDDLRALLAVFVDQYATGTTASLAAISIFPQYTAAWQAALSAGPTALQSVAQNAARAYLRNSDFTGDLTTTPATSSPADVLAALQTEMGAGVDNKTLGTLASTGLVNFFDSLLAAPGTWNTESDSTADYRDAIYVVDSIV